MTIMSGATNHAGRGPGAPTDSSRIAGTATLGVAVILLFFVVMGGWAATTQLAGAVVAPGVVKVVSDRQPVKHQESGVVAEVAVVEGQEVEAGQLLLRLEGTQTRALADQLSAQLDQLMAEEARLIAERDGSVEIAFPESLLSRLEQPAVRQLVDAQHALLASRRGALNGEIDLLSQGIRQMEEQIAGRNAEVASLEKQNALIRQETEDIRSLFLKGYAPKSRLLALERAGAALDGQRSSLLAGVAETGRSIEQSRMRMGQLERDRLTEVSDQLSKAQAMLRDVEPRLRAVRRQLELTEIRAPLAGRVLSLAVRAPGRVVQPSDVLMEIVPSAQALVVEGTIRPEDVDDVHAGMAAEVRLTAFNPRRMPRLAAVVGNVSADRIVDPRSGQPFYQVQFTVDPSQLADAAAALGHEVTLLPGMPAQITIATSERTVLDYLLLPITDGLERAMREP
ncbi:HlyD family type I secretion periplasmic adaptor subunit [Azospirillum sp. RWY-5-1]|uniref:Membrane fusion protein (MFP) family protein n=1 Tax=Azospirillum oleiclasticum TaxID=2735135 RepID=A0ABX2TGF8_9PROT|nr:HlyD family type I secretion periplasmic adaptor subunit [Azospirillum oleiclasticum]NYZ14506.1 HlyD family type I secretion periplasmic adaptor subunit [Azospirillum oleiclasticum]NYZ23142.1 HlyD family type I secretion periplasmic adaptor subunit [Azospirillum oleiclasticum]